MAEKNGKSGGSVIFKTVKVKEDGHHGGAWKIAYADFVTAMMAFFLLLWLLNATSEEVKEGLSNYFQPTLRTTPSTSGAGGIFGGTTVNDPGPVELDSTVAFLDSDSASQTNLDTGNEASGQEEDVSSGDVGLVDAEAEEQSFTRLKQILETTISELPPELEDLKASLSVDITEEGLRVQIIDHDRKSSFTENTDRLTEHARMALTLIAQFVERIPNKLAISGHTGVEEGDTDLWTLSVRRANAARRNLAARGIPAQRFETVIGRGNTEPANPDDLSAPENRRLAVVLVRRAPQQSVDRSRPAPPPILAPGGD